MENLSPTNQRSDRTIHGGHILFSFTRTSTGSRSTPLPGPELQGHILPEQGLLSAMSPNSVLIPFSPAMVPKAHSETPFSHPLPFPDIWLMPPNQSVWGQRSWDLRAAPAQLSAVTSHQKTLPSTRISCFYLLFVSARDSRTPQTSFSFPVQHTTPFAAN